MLEIKQYNMFKLYSFRNMLIYLYLFLFIFTPFILPPSFNIVHIGSLIAYVFLYTKYRREVTKILKNKILFVFILLQLILLLQTIFLGFVEVNFADAYYVFSTIFEVLPICFFIVFYLKKRQISYIQFLNIILLIGFIQFIFVLLSLFFSGFRDLTLFFYPKGNNFDSYFDVLGAFRMFGLTRYYTFAMPVFMGICIIISFVLGSNVSKKYYFLILFYVISIGVNARIGLLSIPIVFLTSFFLQIKKNFKRQMIILFCFFSLIFATILFIQKKAEASKEMDVWFWLNSGFEEILSANEGENKGNMGALADSMWIFPDPVYLMFGTGEDLFTKESGNSDIGYVLNLYFGGVFMSVLLYYSFYKIMSVYDKTDVIQRTIFFSTIFFLFVVNIKGAVFKPNEVINGVLLMSVFTLLYNSDRKSLLN